MDKILPQDDYRPEDEYPSLTEEGVTAAPGVPIEPEIVDDPQTDVKAAAPAQIGAPIQGLPTPPYLPYPVYPLPGMTYPLPPSQYPAQGMVYPGFYPLPPYYAPYPLPQPGLPAPQPIQQPIQQPVQPQQIQPPTIPPVPTQQPAPAAVPHEPNPEPKPKNPPTSTGTKVYLLVLTAVLLAMIGGFIAYVITNADKDAGKADKPRSTISQIEESTVPEDSTVPGGNSIELKHSEFEEEITLAADDGATQQRENDNPDSVGKPDKNADGISLKPLPKDADNTGYTAQTALDKVKDSVVTVLCYESEITENIYDIRAQGSGTIISADGYIVTNAHVIGNSKIYAVNIVMSSGDQYRAKIVGYDTWSDLAVLKIDAKGLTPVVFGDSDLIKVGDDVIAAGNTGGARYKSTHSEGAVTALDKELTINKFVKYIQSDAEISSGCSGGPLCNIYGQVIGINTAKANSDNDEDISFSIPSKTVDAIVNDLIRYGYVRGRARIGFSGGEVSALNTTYFGIPTGLIVDEISEDGALAGTSIRKNDIVTAIDGEKVDTFQDIYAILAKHKPGDKVTLSIYRVEEEGFFPE